MYLQTKQQIHYKYVFANQTVNTLKYVFANQTANTL